MNEELMKLFAFVKFSSYRLKTLKALQDGDKNPTDISKFTGIRVTHTSNVLREFKDCDIAVCINEEKRKNRIYQLTPLGCKIGELIDEDENSNEN